MTIIGRVQRDGVSVEVAPGGALRSVELEPAALQLGGAKLAKTILTLVREAGRHANQDAEEAIRAQLGGLSDEDFAVLGLAAYDEVPNDDQAAAADEGRR
ncbi:hypothetical protein SAMN05216215_108911 [Saccharopolyspora shandongensis]|uniref:YbaB/EbfC DNA-binding family protein n=1 Tax=Saccharopolyspora shandongensis TaxID=418495 RepID=A0A1H3TPQ3_9PSEU|nr:YbaB/EbfC family nucleoid-associated protein [Saccharopolyspora shandongensis]SDZ52273.1 hypothetical protein SAMN05216215_108911 [Saccharopolyspora shandongensis]